MAFCSIASKCRNVAIFRKLCRVAQNQWYNIFLLLYSNKTQNKQPNIISIVFSISQMYFVLFIMIFIRKCFNKKFRNSLFFIIAVCKEFSAKRKNVIFFIFLKMPSQSLALVMSITTEAGFLRVACGFVCSAMPQVSFWKLVPELKPPILFTNKVSSSLQSWATCLCWFFKKFFSNHTFYFDILFSFCSLKSHYW